MNGTMASTYADGLRECSRLHPSIRLEAFKNGIQVGRIDCAEETHADLVERGVRWGVLASVGVALAAWLWKGRWGR